MFPPHLDYLKDPETTWFNPCQGFFGFWREFNKLKDKNNLTFQDAWKSREIKRAKEIYATSIVALATQQSENPKRRWWITKPRQDPPDGVIGTIEESNLGNLIHVREVEVVEHLGGDILETLEEKLNKKSYEPNTILVCLISSTGLYDFKKLSADILEKGLPLDHIFLAGHGALIPSKDKISEQDILTLARQISLIQVKPVLASSSIDPLSICSSWTVGQETNWLKFNGRGSKAGLTMVTSEDPPKLF